MKKRLAGWIAGCAMILAVSGLEAETVAYWQFDDGADQQEVGTITPEVNPALIGTAYQNDGGPKPTFSADRPGDRIWASSDGPLLNGANTASLKFVNTGLPDNPNSNTGGVVRIPGGAPPLHATNLTVETFFKTDRHVNYALLVGKTRSGDGAATTWNLDFDTYGRPRVRIDSQKGDGTGKGNEEFNSNTSVEDGQWHHVAFTYTHTSQVVRVYVDYIERIAKTNVAPLVYNNDDIRIGQGGGGRAFDGWIDEIRITDDVLLPHQFMTVYEPFAVFSFPFQDAPAGTEANLTTNAIRTHITHGTAAAFQNGTAPIFSTERAFGDGALITDGLGGPIISTNTGSLLFTNPGGPDSATGGVITVTGATFTPVTNFTAETFVRIRNHVNYAQIIGKKRTNGWIAWSLACNNNGNLRARFDTNATSNDPGNNQAIESGAKINDGQWHHVAMTYDYPTSTARLYKDYELVHTAVTTNPLWVDTGEYQIGAGDRALDGWIDEVRLTSHVLTPEQFLRAVPIPPPLGTIFLLQ